MSENNPDNSRFEKLPISAELELRALSIEDAETVFQTVDANRDHLGPWFPWVETTVQPEDSETFIRSCIEQRAAGGKYDFGIYLEDEYVGNAGIFHLDDDQIVEIGYWIAQSARGKGIVPKVVQALIKLGFEELGKNEICLRIQHDNGPSMRVAEKTGFKFREDYVEENYFGSGESRQCKLYVMSRDEYKAAKAR